jgi:hypothetical protein
MTELLSFLIMIVILSIPALVVALLLYKSLNLWATQLVNVGVYILIILILSAIDKNDDSIFYGVFILILAIVPISIVHSVTYIILKKFSNFPKKEEVNKLGI